MGPSSSRHTAQALSLSLLCLLFAACTQLAKSLADISRLHAELMKEYGEKEVGVNLNNDSFLNITYVNSLLNDEAPENREKRAQETATFVKQHYGAIKQIKEIWVAFVQQETHYILVHYSKGLGVYGFDGNARPLPMRRDGSRTDVSVNSMRPNAVYSETLKQTDVLIGGMQLEGDVDNGMSVIPHFTVAGDVTGGRRSAAFPDSVRFDFSSSSEKSLFPGEPKIVFLADGKVAYEIAAQFSTSKFGERFSEYLSLPVPYPAFRRMTSGKTLTLRMGDREYEFTSEQLAALREMTEYVRE